MAQNEEPLPSPLMVPSLKVTIENPTPVDATPENDIVNPPTTEFDHETLLDHRKQSKALIHILALCRLIKKDIHRK